MTDQATIQIRLAQPGDAEAIATLFTDEGYPGRTERHRRPPRAVRLGRFPGHRRRARRRGARVHRPARPAPVRARRPDRADRSPSSSTPGARERGVGRALMAEAERIGRELGAAFIESDRRPPPARGAPPVRVARLRRDRHRLPAQEALTDRRSRRRRPASRGSGSATAAGDCWTCPGSCRSRLDWRPRHAVRASATLPVGPSRHLVRFLVGDGRTYALKEEPLARRHREFEVLRQLEVAGLPAVSAVGIAEAPERDSAILVTEYLAFSIQYRRLLMRFPLGPGPVSRPAARRDGVAARRPPPGRRLLGRLLAREHAVPARRRQDPGLPRRCRDERDPPEPVRRPARATTSTSSSRTSASGWPTSARCRAGRTRSTTPSRRPRRVRERYDARVGRAPPRAGAVARRPARRPGPDPAAQRPRVRRRRDRARAEPPTGRRRPAPGRRRQPPLPRRASCERLTGLVALEGQARLLLNDLREYRAWLEARAGSP